MNELQQLETIAQQQLDNTLNSLSDFINTLETIRTSELWRSQFTTWSDYYAEVWQTKISLGWSRIRQLRIAIPLINAIAIETNIELNESNIRTLKQSGYSDVDEIVPIVRRAGEIADLLNEQVSGRHINAVINTLQTLQSSNSLTIGGQSVAADTFVTAGLDGETISALEETIEATRRLYAHKLASRRMARGTMQKTGIGHVFNQIDGDILPDNEEVTIIWKNHISHA